MVEQEPPSRWDAPSGSSPLAGASSPVSHSLSWELVVPAVAASPSQPTAAHPEIAAQPIWEAILPGDEITSADVAREVEADETARQRQQAAASAIDFSDSEWAADRKQRWLPQNWLW
jgi:predicted component of type VI protein secretion system